MEGHADVCEHFNYSTEVALSVLRLNVGIRDSLHAAMLLCVVHSFSLLHTYFGRENRGAVCPLQAGSRSLSSIINLAGTESTNICFD